jgi:hypothetical protein
MDLGVRQIRTAGKGSGSIELTLPSELRDLQGLPCRIMLRDGGRPDIVLQPDLRRARTAFSALWRGMAASLLSDQTDTPALPMAAFTFGLQPRTSLGDMPFLCWRDGLALAGAAPHEPHAVARTLAALAQAVAVELDIATPLAFGFGVACGYLVAGVVASPDGQEACDLAATALHTLSPASAVEACAAGVESDAFWRHAAPRLVAVADLFLGWSADPGSYERLRAAWRRGREIEMSGG